MAKNFDSEILPSGISDTLLILIPKNPHPKNLAQMRPTSLCNTSYKAITKMIANRLKTIIDSVIAPNQSSFVPERLISDNIIIYQEVLNSMRTKKMGKGFMTIKIDLEKAYDRLSWQFIRTLQKN